MARRISSASAPSVLSSPARARGAALTLLGRRDYTSTELHTRLLAKGYLADDVAAALRDLTTRGAVNDRRVAAAHVRVATTVKGRGRYRIARELAARGLSRDLVDEALAAVAPEDDLASIRKILARKRWPARPSIADRRRMFQHLLRRGFAADAIGHALGRPLDDDADDE